jgi:hypothetical protein
MRGLATYHRLGEPATGRHREEKAVRHRSRTAFSFQITLYLGSLTPVSDSVSRGGSLMPSAHFRFGVINAHFTMSAVSPLIP